MYAKDKTPNDTCTSDMSMSWMMDDGTRNKTKATIHQSEARGMNKIARQTNRKPRAYIQTDSLKRNLCTYHNMLRAIEFRNRWYPSTES